MSLSTPVKWLGHKLLGDSYYWVKSFVQRTAYRVGIWQMTTPVKLHLGCGSRHLDDFVNIDLLSGVADILADCTRLSFLKSGVASHILVEHMLEHLSRDEACAALREWGRLLVPGGVLEVEVPDVVWCLENFLATPERERYASQYEGKGAIAAVYGLQTNAGQFHKFGYTPEHLAGCIRDCGLEVQEVKLHMTTHPCRAIRVWARKGNVIAVPVPIGSPEPVLAQIK
jgi:predicted SAM-dependent methyltransferase